MLASIGSLESLRAHTLLSNSQERVVQQETTRLAEQLCWQCQIQPDTTTVKRLVAAALPFAADNNNNNAQSRAALQFGGMDGLLATPAATLTERLKRFHDTPPHQATAAPQTVVRPLPTFPEWIQSTLLAETQSRCDALFRRYRDVANAVKVIPGLSPASRQGLLDDCQCAIAAQARVVLFAALGRLEAALSCRPQCFAFIIEWAVDRGSSITDFTALVHGAVAAILTQVGKICPLARQLIESDGVVAAESEVFSVASQLAGEISELVQSVTSTLTETQASTGGRRIPHLLSCGLTLVLLTDVPLSPTENLAGSETTCTHLLTKPITPERFEALSADVPPLTLAERLNAFRVAHNGTDASPVEGVNQVVGTVLSNVDVDFEQQNHYQGEAPRDSVNRDAAAEIAAMEPEPLPEPAPLLTRVEQREKEITALKEEYPFLANSPACGVYLDDLELDDDARVRPQLNRLRMERMSFGAHSDAVRKQQGELNRLVAEIAQTKQRHALETRERFPFLPFRVRGVLLSNLAQALDEDSQFDELTRIYWKLKPEHREEIGNEGARLAHALALHSRCCVNEAKANESTRLLDELVRRQTELALSEKEDAQIQREDAPAEPQAYPEKVAAPQIVPSAPAPRSPPSSAPPSAFATAATAMLTNRTRAADSHPATPTTTLDILDPVKTEERITPRASSTPAALPPVAPPRREHTDERQQHAEHHPQPPLLQRPAVLEPITPLQQSAHALFAAPQQSTPLLAASAIPLPPSRPSTAAVPRRHPSYQLAPLPSLSFSDLHVGEVAPPLPTQSALPPPKVRISLGSANAQQQRPYTAQPPALLAKRAQRRKSSGASTALNAMSPRHRLHFTSEDSLQQVYSVACHELGLKPNSALVMSLPSEPGLFVSTFDLSTNYVGAKGLQPLLYVLEQNGDHLRRLSLRNNRLENREIVQLTKVLLGVCGSQLTSLDLSHNMISQRGGKCILRLCQTHSNIRTVQLEGTFLTSTYFDALREVLSDVHRIH